MVSPASTPGGGGVRFFSGTSNTISGNVISGNVNEGIFSFPDGNHETILGNFIGTNAAGTPLGNGLDGIKLQSADNTIGGNVVSGNGNNGIWMERAGASNNAVLGNYIGVGPTATPRCPTNTMAFLSILVTRATRSAGPPQARAT